MSSTTSKSGIDLIESFAFVLESREWMQNLAFGFLCFLLPQFFGFPGLVMVLAYWGYSMEVLESRLLYPQGFHGELYPKFVFGRMGTYLHRAIWPMLLTSPLWLAWSLQLVFWQLGPVFSLPLFLDPGFSDESRAAFAIGIPTTVAILMLLAALIWTLLIPVTLRGSLTRSWREMFRVRWTFSFISKMWQELLLTFVFFLPALWVLTICGTALGCFGLFFAQAWCMLAHGNLILQIYREFLRRGGEPIALYQPKPVALVQNSAQNVTTEDRMNSQL